VREETTTSENDPVKHAESGSQSVRIQPPIRLGSDWPEAGLMIHAYRLPFGITDPFYGHLTRPPRTWIWIWIPALQGPFWGPFLQLNWESAMQRKLVL